IPGADPHNFSDMSVRWWGRVRPRYSEVYDFFAPGDSLTRLWINDRLILDFGQGQGQVQFEAGKMYDLRVDWIGHNRNTSALLEWASHSQPREAVPRDCLFPPAHAALIPPLVAIAVPSQGQVDAGPVDVPMSVVIHPGTSTPVQVAYSNGKAPLGVSKTAPFDFVWRDAPLGDHHLVATVTNADGSIGVSTVQHLVIGSDLDNQLPKPWVACDVPAPDISAAPAVTLHSRHHRPRQLQAQQPAPATQPAIGADGQPATAFQNGALTLTSAGGDLYAQEDHFQFVTQRLAGDGSVIARITSISADPKTGQPMGGVMIRTDTLASSAYAAIVRVPNVGDVFLSRPDQNATVDSTSSSDEGIVYFKLSRRGNDVRAYRSTDGKKWEFLGQATLTMPGTMLAGVVACGGDPSVTATVTADHLSAAAETDHTRQFQPYVELTDGTRIVGEIQKISPDSTVTIAPANANPTISPVPLTDIARLVYQPLSPDALSSLLEGQTGAFLPSGDFYEGEVDDLRPDSVIVNSVVFGSRQLGTRDLHALILRPVAAPAAFEIKLSDGSVIESSTLSLAAAGITLHPASGSFTVALKDIAAIESH
ncbi:MAG TPA: PA14 domain-containing protein, partial [Tepidisphaeraceae bacterium]|nr:PA14 domain-containing protein [Tepidisphaeraceae bacterium]